jgi:hypothetical protein
MAAASIAKPNSCSIDANAGPGVGEPLEWLPNKCIRQWRKYRILRVKGHATRDILSRLDRNFQCANL